LTRLTPDERAAIALELQHLDAERTRLQALLDASPVVGDETVRFLRPLCACSLPLDHRRPLDGSEPRPCADETARIALPGAGRPPVPGVGAL
jgi:hypothetical protein